MKHTLLITTALIITALMLTVGYSQETDAKPIDGSTLVWKDGLRYAPDSDKPYSGVAVEYYENGQKSSEFSVKDGKKDGLNTEWYENGQKSIEGTYKDGKRERKWTHWSPDGKESSELIYKDGKAWDGVAMGVSYKNWIKHGVMEKVESYKNGKRDGKWIEYDFSYTGKVKKLENYKDGKRDGQMTQWYENGQKEGEITYKDGKEDGLHTRWHKNGQKRSEETYKDGKWIKETWWDEDGNVIE